MMTSEPIDIDALIERLRNDDDARRRLLAALLPQELLTLPLRVEQIAAEHGERISRLETVVERLVEAVAELRQTVQELARGQQALRETVGGLIQGQEELRASVAELRQTVQELARGQQELWAVVRELAERVKQLEESLQRLLERQIVMEELIKPMRDRFAELVGWRLQSRYAEAPYAFFGRYMKRVKRVDLSEIEDDLRRLLEPTEVYDFFRVDLVLRGRPLNQPDREIYVVLEVSAEIDTDDVVRASRRASLLRKAGYPALAAVGGEKIKDIVRDQARDLKVVVTLDGSIEGWEEAIAAL